MSRQKDKGKYFERQIASKLRESLNLQENECTRAPNSGNGEFEFGDIFFTDPHKHPYIFECKFGYKWDFGSIFPQLNKQITSFVDQAFEARDKMLKKMGQAPKYCFLVLSKPYSPIYLLTRDQVYGIVCYIKTVDINGNTVYVYSFGDVLNHLSM